MIDPSFRKRGLWIILLLAIGSVLDFFSIALFLPILVLIINRENGLSYRYMAPFYHYIREYSMSTIMMLMVGMVLGFVVIKTIFNIWISDRKANYAYQIGSMLGSRSIDRLLRMKYTEFTSATIADEINLIANLPLVIANNIIIPAGTLISEFLVFVLLLISLVLFNPQAFVFLLIIIIPILLLFVYRQAILKKISIQLRYAYPSMLGRTIQIVEGLPDVKAFGKDRFFKGKIEAAYRDLVKIFSKDHVLQSSLPRITEIVAAASISVIIVYTVVTNHQPQETLLLITVYGGIFFRMAPSIGRILSAIQQMKLQEQNTLLYAEKTTIAAADHQYSTILFEREIIFQDVSLVYPDGFKVFNGISFKISKGEKIALTGKSGTGKTSLLLMLMRFIYESSGDILVDGKSIRQMSISAWMGKIGYVPQSPYILDGTIIENIGFGHDANTIINSRIDVLIEQMGLKDWVASLPDGLSTRIGEKGMKISGGQRQRLAIARALYQNVDLLFLDEVTNHLDSQTEREVVDAVLNASGAKQTILIITHHPEVFSRVNKVYELTQDSINDVTIRGSDGTA